MALGKSVKTAVKHQIEYWKTWTFKGKKLTLGLVNLTYLIVA